MAELRADSLRKEAGKLEKRADSLDNYAREMKDSLRKL
jgi:hypothetical protein